MQRFLDALGQSPTSLWIAESTWAFPALEVVHIFAISMAFGTISIIDLRLLGLASTKRTYSELARELLPVDVGCVRHAAACGSILIPSRRMAAHSLGQQPTLPTAARGSRIRVRRTCTPMVM